MVTGRRSVSPYAGRRVFRSPSWVLGAVTAAAVLFAAGAWMQFRVRGLGLVTLTLASFAVLGVAGVAETLAQRVELSDDALHVTRWWMRRSYARDSILRVTSEKGVEAAVQLGDGRWVRLPQVGAHAPNSIRAWLRAGGKGRAEA